MRLKLSLLLLAAVGGLATASVKSKSNEKRINALVSRVSAVEGLTAAQIAALATLSTSQISDLAALSTSQLAAMATITASQYTLLGTTNQTFIAGLSKLPNQSDNNTTLAGVLTWSNNLTDHLISNGFMSP